MQEYDQHQRQVSSHSPASPPQEIQNMHDIFSDPYRSAILYYLQTAEEPAAVSEIAAAIVEWSPDSDDAERADGDRLQAWLLDNHIRQMDEFGMIAYDGSRDLLSLSEDVSVSITTPWRED